MRDMPELSAELTRKLASAVENMPAFPKSVQRILELARDINCSPKELVTVIEKDPIMTMKLLRVLNSAYFSFPTQITSVNQCVVYLGLNTVKNMALSFAAMGTLPKESAAGFDMQRYLMHSLTTAGFARLLSQKYPALNADPTDSYIAGLLHDFGKVVFSEFMTEEFAQVLKKSEEEQITLYQAERNAMGIDHTVVGALLIEKWQFPKGISSLIKDHHAAPPAQAGIDACVFVANQISKKLGYATSGYTSVEELPPELEKRFGGNLEAVIAKLGDISKLIDEASMYASASRES